MLGLLQGELGGPLGLAVLAVLEEDLGLFQQVADLLLLVLLGLEVALGDHAVGVAAAGLELLEVALRLDRPQLLKAAVELRPGHEASGALTADILAFCRSKLAGYKVPRSLDYEAELPRTAAGKLYVRRLRDRYWAGRDRQI